MRRIDILGVPFPELGAALIYFTGNDIFNRSLRLKARHMGYSLNQRGAVTKQSNWIDADLKVGNYRSIQGCLAGQEDWREEDGWRLCCLCVDYLAAQPLS